MPQCLATKTMPRMVKVDVLLEGEDIMRAVEGLVEDVTVLVMAVVEVVEVVHVVDVSQATGVVKGGGSAGGTRLFESK